MFDYSYLNIVMFSTKGPFVNYVSGIIGIDLEFLIKASWLYHATCVDSRYVNLWVVVQDKSLLKKAMSLLSINKPGY